MEKQNRGVTALSGAVIRDDDLQALQKAKRALDSAPGLLSKFANTLGEPIADFAGDSEMIMNVTQEALTMAVEGAVKTMDGRIILPPSDWLHKGLVSLTGAVGGAAGLPGLVVELPLTTVVMLRSIADIARSYGEDINSEEVKMECLSVFSFGGGKKYFELRWELATTVTGAAKYLASSATSKNVLAPAVVQLIEHIAARYSIQISQKAAAQAVPVIGAVSGVVINNLFMAHFQEMADSHFCIRKLEREYGTALIRQEYDKIGLPKP